MSNSKDAKNSSKTEENGETDFKTPTPEVTEISPTNGTDTKDLSNGKDDSPKMQIQTRARSKTPLLNKSEKAPVDGKLSPKESVTHTHDTRSRSKTPQKKVLLIETSTEVVSLDTKDDDDLNLVIEPVEIVFSGDTSSCVLDKEDDEIIPELIFDENDVDDESEGSPSRCKTRRSQLHLVHTPKTPKLIDNEDADEKVLLKEDKSDTQSIVSIDNISTTATIGNDTTQNDDSTPDLCLSEYTYQSPDRSISFRETVKNISSRRTIHAMNTNNYRKYALENNRFKSDSPVLNYDPIERVAGVKRKSSSIELNNPKKFKESSGLLGYITIPIGNLKNSLLGRSNPNEVDIDVEKSAFSKDILKVEIEEPKNERGWCSVM